MLVRLRRLDRLQIADIGPGRAVRRLGAILCRVDLAQLERIDLQLMSQLVEAALRTERRVRRAGRAVGGDLRPVRHDIVADDVDVRDVVHREAAHAGRSDRRAREGPGLQLDDEFGRHQLSVLLGAELDLIDAASGRAAGAEYLLATHHELDRAPGLLRQRQRDRFQINERLAAEPAADLGRDRADIGHVDAEQLGAVGAHHELALARTPDCDLPVGGGRHHAGVRLDIGLVHRLARIAALDRDLGLLPALREIALHEGDPFRDVRRGRRFRIDALRVEIVVQDRRVRLHRVLDIDDVRQHLVLNLDQVDRFVGDPGFGGGHRRDSVAFIKRLVARHAVARQVAEVHRPLADKGFLGRDLRKIRCRDDGLDPRQGQRLLRVDRLDPCVRVRAALDLGPQHSGHCHVGAEIRAPDDLFNPVRTDRPGADDLQRGLIEIRHAICSMTERETPTRWCGRCKLFSDFVISATAGIPGGRPIGSPRIPPRV